jgi:hypothetical protein
VFHEGGVGIVVREVTFDSLENRVVRDHTATVSRQDNVRGGFVIAEGPPKDLVVDDRHERRARSDAEKQEAPLTINFDPPTLLDQSLELRPESWRLIDETLQGLGNVEFPLRLRRTTETLVANIALSVRRRKSEDDHHRSMR